MKWAGFPESENSWERSENVYCTELVRDFEEERAFDEACRGKIIDKIVGAIKEQDKIYFIVKWKNTEICDLVSSHIINVRFPQDVIQFYQQRLGFI